LIEVKDGQVVVTYTPGQWPVGVLTGHEGANGFFLEHVITFPGANAGDLVGMLSHGFQVARERKYAFVAFRIAKGYPTERKLTVAARWFGFTLYYEDDTMRHYVLHLEA